MVNPCARGHSMCARQSARPAEEGRSWLQQSVKARVES
jgi:hypothetical protein